MYTLLIVDHNVDRTLLLKQQLERERYRVIQAVSGQEGLTKLMNECPDLVLLDTATPDVDGWALCCQMYQACDVPIVLLTALASTDDIVKGLSCGADDVVSKPFSQAVLGARLRAILRRGRKAGVWSNRSPAH